MVIGEVIGNIWATRKEEGLTGLKFLVIQPEDKKEHSFVAADRIGAGVGDKVFVTRGSASASGPDPIEGPVDALITGIVDSVEVERGGNNG